MWEWAGNVWRRVLHPRTVAGLRVAGIGLPIVLGVLAVFWPHELETPGIGWFRGVFLGLSVALLVVSVLSDALQRAAALLPVETFNKLGEECQATVSAFVTEPIEDPKPVAERMLHAVRRQVVSVLGLAFGSDRIACDLMLAVEDREQVERWGPVTNPYGAEAGQSVGADGLVDADARLFLVFYAEHGRHPATPPIYLRVAKSADKLLPGAPRAVATLQKRLSEDPQSAHSAFVFDHLDDVRDIPKLKYGSDTSPDLRTAVENYFTGNKLKSIRSVVSVALAFRGVVVGILNITWAETGLFKETPRQHLIEGAVRPYVPLLASLCHSAILTREAPADG